MSGDLKSAKASLRRRILAQRDALAPDLRQARSAKILRSILDLPGYRSANVVAAYASFGSEIDTWDVLRDALRAGKVLLLPRVDRQRHRLDLYRVHDLVSDLAEGVWGIREPAAHCSVVPPPSVEFMLVPGVAFTPHGDRLGYGGGYYDRLLIELGPSTPRVAAAFEVQVVDALPVAEHDQRVHQVVTEQRILPA